MPLVEQELKDFLSVLGLLGRDLVKMLCSQETIDKLFISVFNMVDTQVLQCYHWFMC